MIELTATQKIRLTLTGDPAGTPQFQHEGTGVVRWITGGVLPDAYATFSHNGAATEARCPACDNFLGQFPADYSGDTAEVLVAMRRLYPLNHQH